VKIKLIIYALAALTVTNGAQAQSPAGNTVPVTIENYNRAQTDVYFAGVVKSGGFGNSGMAANLHRLSSRASSGPTATHCIRSRLWTSMRAR
jgi:hypothetical protein